MTIADDSLQAAGQAGARRASLPAVWAFVLAGCCAVITLVAVARLAAEVFGATILYPDEARLRQVLLLHAALAAALAGAGMRYRRKRAESRGRLRLLAVLTPLIMLVSADRICNYLVVPYSGTTAIFMHDPDLGWRLRPGAAGEWDGCQVIVNPKGLRGPELPYQKPAGEFRILFLGDSIAFAVGVTYEQGFAAGVQRLLAPRETVRRVTTLACAVPGYSPWQERILLEQEGLKYQPDLVVECFCLNDVTQPYKLIRFGGSELGTEAALTASPLDWSGLYRAALQARAYVEIRRNRNNPLRGLADLREKHLIEEPDSPLVQSAWRLATGELGKIAAVCRRNGVPVAVVCFPLREQVSAARDEDRPQQELRAFCSQQGIPCLDLLPGMRAWQEAHPTEGFPMRDSLHPNAIGHALVAEQIVEFLHRAGLVPSERRPSSDAKDLKSSSRLAGASPPPRAARSASSAPGRMSRPPLTSLRDVKGRRGADATCAREMPQPVEAGPRSEVR